MNSLDALKVVPSMRQCTDYSVRSILSSTSSSTGRHAPPSLPPPSHGYVGMSVADLEGTATIDLVSEGHRAGTDVVPPSSILSELQRTVSDRTSVSLTGRVGVASGADFILAPVVGAGAALRPFDMLDQRRRSGCDDLDCSSLAGDAVDGAESPTVELEYKPLWDQFATLGTEMVITKSGRSVFCQCLANYCSFSVVYGRITSQLAILTREFHTVQNRRCTVAYWSVRTYSECR